jgi:hypothetical protein
MTSLKNHQPRENKQQLKCFLSRSPALFCSLSLPLSTLDHRELLWLAGILKDACRERLEKNQVSQAFEDRLYQRGPVEGRLDPRPFLKIWEPRYRKFLTVASELQALLEAEDARATAQSLRDQAESLCDQAESLRAQFAPKAAIGRPGPGSARHD